MDFPDGYLPISFAHQSTPYMSSVLAIGNTVHLEVNNAQIPANTVGVVVDLSGKGTVRKALIIVTPQSGTSLETLKDVAVLQSLDGSGYIGKDLESMLGMAMFSNSSGQECLLRFDDVSMQYAVGIFRQIRFDSNYKLAINNPYDEDIYLQILMEYEILP